MRAQLVRPVALGALTGFMLLASSSDVFGASMARPMGAISPIVKGVCSSRPKAAILLDSALGPTGSPSSSGSASGTAKASDSTSASGTPTASNSSSERPTAKPTTTKTASPTPKPTTTKSSSPSPKPTSSTTSPSPHPTPSHSSSPPTTSPTSTPTKTPSPSPSPSKQTPQLCVSVQSLTTSSQVRPGHKAGFAIWVWSTHGDSKSVTVDIHIGSAKHVDAPRFTVCPSSGTAACGIGTLPAGQADELQATAAVQSSAVNGEQVDLSAAASGKGSHSFTASGSVVVTATTPTPTPTTSSPPAATTTLPPVSLPPVTGSGTSLGNPAGLFPTVSPAPSQSPGGTIGFPPAKKRVARAATVAAIVPLDPRLIGGQLAGLAVLAGAIAIAIARLSFRRPKPQDGPAGQGKNQSSS